MKRIFLSVFLCLPVLADAAVCEVEDKSICKAADKGDTEAQLTLGYMYYSGEADRQDSKLAFQWFKKAAEQGNATALNWLGKMYHEGEVDLQDYTKTFKLFKISAEQGNQYAQFYLGDMYKEGIGVNKDYRQAYLWIEKAAEQGNAEAQFELGIMSKEAQTYGKAIKWFNKSAENNNAEAQFELASIYHYGSLGYHGVNGVEKNREKAIYWYEKALSNGYFDDAKKRLDELNSESYSSNKGVMSSVIGWGKSITGDAPIKEEDNYLHVVNLKINIGSRQVGSFFSSNYYSNKRICNDAIKQMYVAATNGITLSATCVMNLGPRYDAPLDEVRLAGVTYMGYQQASKFSTYKRYPISDFNECKSIANQLRGQAEKEPSGFFGIFFCTPEQNISQVTRGYK